MKRQRISRRIFPVALWAILVAASCGGHRPQCGLASLTAVLRSQGQDVSYEDLERARNSKNPVTSFRELRKLAAAHEVRLEGTRLTMSELQMQAHPDAPAILELHTNHLVACLSVGRETAQIVDPRTPDDFEPVTWSLARLERQWTGRALVCSQHPLPVTAPN